MTVHARAFKMSKSRGNVVNPDDVVISYGADSLRLYEMFMGPLRDTKVWSTKSVEGVHRFLARVWRLFENGACSHCWPFCSLVFCSRKGAIAQQSLKEKHARNLKAKLLPFCRSAQRHTLR